MIHLNQRFTNNNKKITFICQVFHPDPISTSQLFSPMMQKLCERGWDVEVIAGRGRFSNGKPYPKSELWNGVKILRCGISVNLKSNFINRSISYLTYLFHMFFLLMSSSRIDTIWFGVTNPPFNSWVLSLASFLRRKKYIYMMLDLHPEGIIALGRLKSSSWLTKLWKIFNSISLKNTSSVLILGRDMMPILNKNYKISKDKLKYVPHWSSVPNNSTLTFNQSRLSKNKNLKEKFVVQYSGNMGLWHDIDTIIHSANIIDSKKIVFHFIGDGIRKNKAMTLANKLNISNVIWSDFVPIKDLRESLAACHISIISLNSGLEGVAVPSKIYSILASGRPIIAQVPSKSEIALTVNEHKCGIVVNPGDHNELKEAIMSLFNDSYKRKKMGQNAFNAYKKYYKIEVAISSLERIFEDK